MVRTLTVILAVVLLCATASAEIIYDFEGASLPTGVTPYGNAGTAGSFGPITPRVGTALFGASTGTGTNPYGTPIVVNSLSPLPFVSGNPAPGTPNGNFTGALVEYSGLGFNLNLTVDSFVGVWMTLATGEGTVTSNEDIVQVWVQDNSTTEFGTGFVIDPAGGTTYNEDYTGFPTTWFSGTSFTDTALGTFGNGELMSGWFKFGGDLQAGSYTVYVVVADFDENLGDTAFFLDSVVARPVPEPGTWLLFGMGALGLLGYRRFRKSRK